MILIHPTVDCLVGAKSCTSPSAPEKTSVATLGRPCCVEASGTMSEKREETVDSSSEEPGCKKPKMEPNWCADCWAPVEDGCRADHRLVDRDEAARAEQAEVARVQAAAEKEMKRMKKRHRAELERLQNRLQDVASARAAEGPVLELTVDPTEERGFTMAGGGPVLIGLATTEATSEDKDAVCRALEGLRVHFDEFQEKERFYGLLKSDRVKTLSGVLDKLPDCVDGQAVRNGTVLLSAAGRLEVYTGIKTWRGKNTKEFGQVQSDDLLDAVLEYEVCDNYCKPSRECCCTTGVLGSTTLSGVKFQTEG